MADRYGTNPFNNGTGDPFTFDEITTLVAMAALACFAIMVFSLGSMCATHRIETAIALLR